MKRAASRKMRKEIRYQRRNLSVPVSLSSLFFKTSTIRNEHEKVQPHIQFQKHNITESGPTQFGHRAAFVDLSNRFCDANSKNSLSIICAYMFQSRLMLMLLNQFQFRSPSSRCCFQQLFQVRQTKVTLFSVVVFFLNGVGFYISFLATIILRTLIFSVAFIPYL